MDLSASDRSARTYESDFEAVLILKESVLPVVETQHRVEHLLNALRPVLFSYDGEAKLNKIFCLHSIELMPGFTLQ